MSRPSIPYDNAMIEIFFANLKLKINDGRPFKTREAANTAIVEYIKVFYNRARLHSGLATPRRYKPNSNINRSGMSPDYSVHETRGTPT